MTRAESIYHIDEATPEARLVAAVIKQAIFDARAGGTRAWRWLHNDALDWLLFIIPPTADPAAVHRRLLATIDRPIAERQRSA